MSSFNLFGFYRRIQSKCNFLIELLLPAELASFKKHPPERTTVLPGTVGRQCGTDYFSACSEYTAMASLLNEETPGFDFIQIPSENPFILFNQWYEEVKKTELVLPGAFTLATVSGDGKPSARTLLMRRKDSDGFVFSTHKGGSKVQELTANPSAAMVFLWGYMKNGDRILQQVRVEGHVTSMSKEECQVLHDQEPLYCKMRSHLCSQGEVVDWQHLQDSYIQMLDNVKNGGQQLTMPDEFVGYKLTADMMEFYFCTNNKIADRVVFKRKVDDSSWSHQRIAA